MIKTFIIKCIKIIVINTLLWGIGSAVLSFYLKDRVDHHIIWSTLPTGVLFLGITGLSLFKLFTNYFKKVKRNLIKIGSTFFPNI
jgi:hypothetical protein